MFMRCSNEKMYKEHLANAAKYSKALDKRGVEVIGKEIGINCEI